MTVDTRNLSDSSPLNNYFIQRCDLFEDMVRVHLKFELTRKSEPPTKLGFTVLSM